MKTTGTAKTNALAAVLALLLLAETAFGCAKDGAATPQQASQTPPEPFSVTGAAAVNYTAAGAGKLAYAYSDAYFDGSAEEFSRDLALYAFALAWSAASADTSGGYTDAGASGVKNLLAECGFSDVTLYGYDYEPTADSIAAAFGHKTLPDGAELVAIAVRGGGYGAEWASNFTVVPGDEYELAPEARTPQHGGFHASAQKVLDYLDEYTAGTGWYDAAANVKVLVTGYSRGAAVANVAAARLSGGADYGGAVSPVRDKLAAAGVFAYTFATPRTVPLSAAGTYGNIFNIVNPADPVTYVPAAEWGYARYGVDIALPSPSDAEYAERFPAMLAIYATFPGCNEQNYLIDDFQYRYGTINIAQMLITDGVNSENQITSDVFLRDRLMPLLAVSLIPDADAYVAQGWQDAFVSAAANGFSADALMRSDLAALLSPQTLVALAGDPENINTLVSLLPRDGAAFGPFTVIRTTDYVPDNLTSIVQGHMPEVYLSWLTAIGAWLAAIGY
ncbi:MAG: hypothetical protein LBS90_05145 [Oscillospiraceae bacterium]|nr:hypothetical protein [Oscillospiraceae bacterium]